MALQINNNEPKKIKLKPEIKVDNYYFVKSQYKFKPHTLYKIIKETNKTIKCQEMEYDLLEPTYNEREGTTTQNYFFEKNIYKKNDWKIKTFAKAKIDRQNIWTYKKLDSFPLNTLVQYND